MQQVFLDVDTQIDFIYPTGALSVPDATQILPNLAALTQFALAGQIPLISTADAHLEDDAEFSQYAPHCVAGTFGANKVPETLSAKAFRVGVGERAPAEWQGQLILEKRSLDMFAQPSIAALLESLNPDRFVVYGVVTEICVMHAVEGLLRLGKSVTLLSDAIFALEASKAHDLITRWKLRGCSIAKTADIVA